MSFLNNIKNTVGNIIFKHKLKKNKREVVACNLALAKKIGFIYDASNEEQIKIIKNFINEIKIPGHKYKSLGFVNADDFQFCHMPKLEFDYFNLKDINWVCLPKSNNHILQNFIKEPFDILINTTQGNLLPVYYLTGLSEAKFKIGINANNNIEIHDMLLNIAGNFEPKYVLSQAKEFLLKINDVKAIKELKTALTE